MCEETQYLQLRPGTDESRPGWLTEPEARTHEPETQSHGREKTDEDRVMCTRW